MAASGPNYNSERRKYIGAVIFLVAMSLIAAITLYVKSTSISTSTHKLNPGISLGQSGVNLRPELQKVAQPPTAKEISKQLHGLNFAATNKGQSGMVIDAGSFYIGAKKMAVDTFVSPEVRDEWLKRAEQLGVVPYWVSSNAIVYPSVGN